MATTRRRFLSAAALLGSAGVLGSVAAVGAVRMAWWDQPAASTLQHVSTDEVAFLDQLADAIFPPGDGIPVRGRDAAVSFPVDSVLAGLHPTQRKLLRLSFHALDQLPRATHGAPFRELSEADAKAVLDSWLHSELTELRAIVSSTYIFVAMAWSLHPKAAPLIAKQFRCGYGA